MELHRIYGLYSSWIDFVIYFSIFGSAIRIALWNVFDDKRAVKLLIVGGGAFFALSLTLWTQKYGFQIIGLWSIWSGLSNHLHYLYRV